ncbi:hypothetical protein AMTRI_Chr04g251230 [Amborella trichopoda]
MAQGRGSAMSLVALVFVMICLLEVSTAATTYTVGDSRGWTFNMVSWPAGKRFRAGDVLVFQYDKSAHNVVAVNAAGYKSCLVPRGSRTYRSGSDRITLRRGANFFLCSIPGHCQSGMKVQVNAA